MSLFILTIPLMVLALAAAAIPLIVLSHREHKRHLAEFALAESKRAPYADAVPTVIADVTGREAREAVAAVAA